MKLFIKIGVFVCVIFFTSTVRAQIKTHDDNHISLMSLTKVGGLQIQPNGYTYFNPSFYNDWAWMTLTIAKSNLSKCWIVHNDINLQHTFFVTGAGGVYYKSILQIANPITQATRNNFENASHIISKLNGYFFRPINESLNYDSLHSELLENESVSKDAIDDLLADYYKNEIGFVASNVEESLPDAIRTVSDGRKAIDYNAILVVLIEAFKQQQEEINNLRQITEKAVNRESNEWNLENTRNSFDENEKRANNAIDNKSSCNTESSKSILYQNAPNPFNSSTNIEYEINEPITQKSMLNIYNLQGTQLKSYPVVQGKGNIAIFANELQAGIYFYSLIVNNREIDTKKMILTNFTK